MHTLQLLLGTVILRPYVFLFLVAYLIAAVYRIGVRRTFLFTIICWAVAFLSEYSSTRNGFPYGIYHYIETTRAQELWISNVPFMDSLSYTFLRFASMSMVLLVGWRPDRPWRFATASAVLVMILDIIIDPVANQGEKWFLGKIYYYPNGGWHFGVPLTNYLGWFLVGLTSIRLYLWLEQRLSSRSPRSPRSPRSEEKRNFHLPLGDYFGVGLYYGVALFNLGVTAYIGDYKLLAASSLVLTVTTLSCWYLRKSSGKHLQG
jgi:putative membrane protein